MSKLLSMIRSKKQTMYATIKGTLTENDGVFSGFSTSNYLTLQRTFGIFDTFEFVFKLNVTTSGSNGFFGSSNSLDKQGIALQISTDMKLKYYLSSNGTSWDIGSGSGNSIFTINTDFYIKVQFTGTQYIISSSTDNINWIIEKTIVSSTKIYIPAEPYNIGYNIYTSGSQQYFRGLIDLPNSYIKLDRTKYNLQAVVGYTIVGSPTIVDGVVSGFSSTNYIYIPNFDIGNDFELITKIKILTNKANNYLLRLPRGNANLNMACYISSSNKLKLSLIFNNKPGTETTGTTTLSINTDIYLKLVQKGNITKFFSSQDKLNWIEEMSIQTDKDIRGSGTGYEMSFGIASISSGYYFSGLIYIGETTINVKNKLWFNGYPA